MKAFVIGDIHGCLEELEELIKDINRDNTRIILVGDLIDRGKDSQGVINFVRDNNIECVKGNHELMAEECLPYLKNYTQNSNKRSLYLMYESDWFYNGGHDVFNQYKANSSIEQLIADIEWLSTLPLYIETGVKDELNLELLVSHTWCSYKNLKNAYRNQFDFVWNRSQPKGIKNTSEYYNIYGHTPVDYINQNKYHKNPPIETIPEPEWFDGAAAIDTGCAYNVTGRGYLTGVFFPSLEFKQVKLKDNNVQ